MGEPSRCDMRLGQIKGPSIGGQYLRATGLGFEVFLTQVMPPLPTWDRAVVDSRAIGVRAVPFGTARTPTCQPRAALASTGSALPSSPPSKVATKYCALQIVA